VHYSLPAAVESPGGRHPRPEMPVSSLS
jgi:hypothetical protein